MAHGYEMAAFDMDGTLLNDDKNVTPATLAAIRRAAAAGKVLAMNTGRCYIELTDYIERLPEIQYVNCLSGALVVDTRTGETIYENTVRPETVLQLMDLTADEDVMLHLLSRVSHTGEYHVHHMDTYQMGVYQPMFERLCTTAEDIRAYYRETPFPVHKVNFYHRSVADREVTRARIEAAGIPVTLADAEIASLECSPPGVGKNTGLEAIAANLGFTMAEVIVVGDAGNDRAGLLAAGLPIAMGNATPDIKAICQAVVADCNHDGCAEVIERYLLS